MRSRPHRCLLSAFVEGRPLCRPDPSRSAAGRCLSLGCRRVTAGAAVRRSLGRRSTCAWVQACSQRAVADPVARVGGGVDLSLASVARLWAWRGSMRQTNAAPAARQRIPHGVLRDRETDERKRQISAATAGCASKTRLLRLRRPWPRHPSQHASLSRSLTAASRGPSSNFAAYQPCSAGSSASGFSRLARHAERRTARRGPTGAPSRVGHSACRARLQLHSTTTAANSDGQLVASSAPRAGSPRADR
jgi:hypothetical protein